MASVVDPAVDPRTNSSTWDVRVNGTSVRWNRIEVTFEQFHIPGQFCVELPEGAVSIETLLTDSPPEVVIRRDNEEFFIGLDTRSGGNGTDGDQPDDPPQRVIRLSGKDLSEKFVLDKVTAPLPMNLTASEIVTQRCLADGFTQAQLDITSTNDQIGEFVRRNYHRITKSLSWHDVFFDLAELEHFVFRVWRRRPFFGPQPDPKAFFNWQFGRDFNTYDWHKSHVNSDVKVRVLGWNPKTKQRTSDVQGSGSFIITKVVAGITPLQAKAMAVRILEEAERGLFTMDLTNVPGDPRVNDVAYGFRLTGLAAGLNRLYYPSRVHHIITQDDHVMDLKLYNSVDIAA